MTDARTQPAKVFDLVASPNGIRRGLSLIRMHLRQAGVSSCECGTAEIVLAEALNNIAEHAYANRGAGGINVTIALDDDGVAIEVTDTGAPLPGLTAPAGNPPKLDGPGHALPEGGYGWFLIRKLTAGLAYNRHNGRNILQLRMNLPCSRQGENESSDARSA